MPDNLVEQDTDSAQPAQPETDGTALGKVVHEVFAKVRTKTDCEAVDELIDSVIRRNGRGVSKQTVREHVHRFLKSELGKTALAAPETHCEQHLYAQIGVHIVHGITDRLFKGSDGLWQIIDYKTDAIYPSEIEARVNYHRPQLELYALLAHRLYPEQPTIPVTLFFSHLAAAYPIQYRVDTLTEIEANWITRIEEIQRGMLGKNTAHCPLCPYFVNNRCLDSNG